MPDASSEARNAKAAAISRRLHEAAHRHARELAVEVLHHRRPDRALGHVGVREARADAVDADAVRRELERHRAVEPEQARLRGVVARERPVAARGVDRRVVQDHAAAGAHHLRRHRAATSGTARSGSCRRPSRQRSSVISRNGVSSSMPALLIEHVDAPPQRASAAATAPSHLGRRRARRTGAPRPCRPRRWISSAVSSSGSRRAPDQHHVGALGREPLRRRLADAAARRRSRSRPCPRSGASRPSYPLSAPAVRPRMKKRWPTRYRSSIGTDASSIPAISTGTSSE